MTPSASPRKASSPPSSSRLSTSPPATAAFPRRAFAAHTLLAVLLGCPAALSFAPPSLSAPSSALSRQHHHHQQPQQQLRNRHRGFLVASAGGGGSGSGGRGSAAAVAAVCRLGASRGEGWEGEEGEGGQEGALSACGGVVGRGGAGWGSRRSARRRSSRLQAAAADGPDDKIFRVRNVASSLSDEDKIQTGSEDDMRRLMYELDPDSDEQGPMYFGTDGMDGPEQIWEKAPEEVRFDQCYLAFCVDREETKEEPKNFVFWGLRQKTHMAHLKWARVLARTFKDSPDRDAAILWNRSILSPSKYKVMGNMMCIRSDSKEAAIRLLEADPFRKAGLYGTVSLYRYPYSLAGEFNWQLAAHPYLALCMDKKGKGKTQLRKDTRPRHLEYLGNTKRCTGAGPIFDSSLDEDDPNSAPIGSLVFFNAGTDEEARETVENDPYNDAGLFDSIFVARFNELDLDGMSLAKPTRFDPMRNIIAKEGLDVPSDYPVTPEWKPFDNLTWLDSENEKKTRQEYMEKRRTLYEQRDIRLEKDQINKGAQFKYGAYVYMGKRSETEWYDYWPTRFAPDDGLSESRFELENSYPPVDILTDDLD